jgi:antitoxin component of MazEF toxin-antitoxin module
MKSQNTVTKISKWGNGYGIRVPVATLETYNLTEGSEVVLSQEPGGVKISPKESSLADMSLAEIMKGVVPAMLAADNAETTFGVPQGNEVW